jgi:hypothetical protein
MGFFDCGRIEENFSPHVPFIARPAHGPATRDELSAFGERVQTATRLCCTMQFAVFLVACSAFGAQYSSPELDTLT